MSVVINLRGTGGSGKSTVVRRVMELYTEKLDVVALGRKQPQGYLLTNVEGMAPHDQLYVPGHYNTACGGCDTIKTVDLVYELVNRYVELGSSVLYEGIMVQDDVRRAVELDHRLKEAGVKSAESGTEDKQPSGLFVIRLNTPIEVSLASIRARRAEAGNEKPLSEKNTRTRHESQVRIAGRLKDAGVRVEVLDREAAYLRVCTLLRLTPAAS